MTITTAQCRAGVVLFLLGILTGRLGRAAALPPIYRVVQGPGMASSPQDAPKSSETEYVPNTRFRLRTALAEGKLAFVGVGGEQRDRLPRR
jgi:hypothetical protein